MKCAAASATTALYCACVQNPPGSTSLPSGADRAAAADGGQPGEALDRQTEALVVAEVQVQHVDLVGGDLADQFLDRRRRLVVPGDVKQQAAVGVAGIVGDGDHRRCPWPGQDRRAVDPRRQELPERLNPVVEAMRGRRLDRHAGRGGDELITLGPMTGPQGSGIADLQGNVTWARRADNGPQPVPGRRPQVGSQVTGNRRLGRGVGARCRDNPGVPGEREMAAADARRHRLRHDNETGCRPGSLLHRSRASLYGEDNGGDTDHQHRETGRPDRQHGQAMPPGSAAGRQPAPCAGQ